MSGYDLHSHTVFSDGTTTPEHNLRLAVELGLDGLGVTDHDTAAHIEPFQDLAADLDVEIIPGTEFSAELGERSVHVLGYWFDPSESALADEMDRVRNERERRAEEIVVKFNDLGIPITFERVTELAGNAPVGRPHIARAVVELGAAEDTTEVFDRWLQDGGPAYVPKYAVDPVKAVELIVNAGGVAVVAHPGLYGGSEGGLEDVTIEAMAGAGMAGIEADHPDHTPDVRARYRDLAIGLGLIVTAGSDYHGANKDLPLGGATTTRAAMDDLRARRP